jgi:hypothetical protein
VDHESRGPQADAAQLRPDPLRGRLPLRPGALPRRDRGRRACARRGGRSSASPP